MKKMILSPLVSCCLSILFFSCSFAPINNQYEKAGTLKKGNVELTGSVTGYSVTSGGETSSSNNNYGFRAGLGITDKFDLKLRYERLIPANRFDAKEFGGSYAINYYSIVPKIALIPERFSLLVPLSLYTFKDEYNGTESTGTLGSIAPQLIYTATKANKKADVSFGLKADILLGGGGGSLLLGPTIGAGFSTDLSKWAIRPEIGASILGGGAFLSYGLGFQFIIPKNQY